MTYIGQTLMANDLTADGGSDWFLTRPGDVFSAATIEAGLFPVLVNAGSGPTGNGQISTGHNDFYLGLRTGSGFTNDLPNRTAYGWVHVSPMGRHAHNTR